MKYYYIWTIGCQMNKSESSRFASFLHHNGYLETTVPEDADLIIINSCVVRQSAEDRVINKLYSLRRIKSKNPMTRIAVTGCIVDVTSDNLKRAFPFVDYFFPAGVFPEWLGEFILEKSIPAVPGVTAFLPVMQGCNNYCSYCIVPFRRGPEKSRPPAEIICEANLLVSRGVKEITLLGQNVNSYGKDLPEKPDLSDLLIELNRVNGLKRLRFLTNHPKDMPDKLIRTIKDLDKVCHQINLPVQSGDDIILEKMRRGYTVENYQRLIQNIRDQIPDIALSTDLIVGFPGETEKQFLNSYNLIKEIRFDMVHVAAYSARSGTLAASTWVDDVPAEVKKNRLAAIENLQKSIASEINQELKGYSLEILVEGRKKSKWFGRTSSDKLVFFADDHDFYAQLVKVKISHASPWSLSGKLE